MFEEIKNITSQEIEENGVCAAPDVLTGSPDQNKKIFDRLNTKILIPKINVIIEAGKMLEEISDENSESLEALKTSLANLENAVGDVEGFNFSGENLCEKIMSFFNIFAENALDLSSKIGSFDKLKFLSTSTIDAINYVYDFFYESKVFFLPSLPDASLDYYMKIVRVFDIEENVNKYFICKKAFPKTTGLYVGKTVGRLYFDPHATASRFIAFKEHYKDQFELLSQSQEIMNVISFANENNPADTAYLQIRYSKSVDGYGLVIEKGDTVTPVWGSKRFVTGGITYPQGYSSESYTDLFSGYKITEIKGNLLWIVNGSDFVSEYYWDEIYRPWCDVSVIKSGKNSIIEIKKPSGTQTFSVKDGVNGYTPVKGQDYFTPSDIDEISAIIEEELRNEIVSKAGIIPEFVSSVEECTDETKLYVLPDGFIYRYSEETVTNVENMVNYGKGILLNHRLSTSGVETPQNGLVLLDYIDIDLVSPYLVKISGMDISSVYDYAIHVTSYDENKKRLGASLKYITEVFKVDGVYTIDLYEMIGEKYPNTKYVRMAIGVRNEELFPDDEDVNNLMVDFVPKNTVVQKKILTNTNHSFASIDYGEQINELFDITSENAEGIYILNQRMDNMGNGSHAIPSYWEGAVSEVASKIQEKQREFGINGVTFAFFSDNHTRLGYAGSLIWEVMQRCNIPFAFFGGDSIDSGTIESKALMEQQETNFAKMMSCIPKERFHRALGNHDGYYLTSDGQKYNCTWEEKYYKFLSPLAVSSNRIFGKNGTYYYVDEPTSKTRFIILNSIWFDHQTNEDGTINNPDKAGFGNEQLNWLFEVLSSLPDGYDVVLMSHSPVSNTDHSNLRDAFLAQGIVNAFIEGGTFEGEYTQSVNPANNSSVSVSFSKKGNVIGWFSGHIHKDRIITADAKNGNKLSFKTVTITSDANISYDEAEAERDMNGDTSHAIDFVTVNKKTGDVFLFRLGVGNDRTYNYLEE